MSSDQILIIGGGLAGAAAAIVLARGGRSVILLEREREPKHKVCGEFLSTEALHLLAQLGVDPAALGAVPVHGVRLASTGNVSEHALPFAAMSLMRQRLDPALLEAAESVGVNVRRGVSVEALTREHNGWRVALSDGGVLLSDGVVLASGKHDVRGHSRPEGSQGDLVAMKMYWRLAPGQAQALGHNVELLLHPGGYTGIEPVQDGSANLCCLVQRPVLSRIGGWNGLVQLIRESCPHAKERLAGAEPLLSRPLAIASIPYGFVRAVALGERLWAVGDQAAVIPSFTGDGMSIALYSGVRAGESVLSGESVAVFQRSLHAELRWQVARATLLSRALVSSPTKQVLVHAVRLWPGLLSGAATATRLPGQAFGVLPGTG